MGLLDTLGRVPRALRVVVADDERDTVLTLSALLGTEGHRVIAAYTGREVIDEVHKTRPDAVIADIAMPGMSGYGVARELRRVYGDEAPLMIAISGMWIGPTDRMLSRLSGFDHYLQKPCDPAALLALLAPLATRPPRPLVDLTCSTHVPL